MNLTNFSFFTLIGLLQGSYEHSSAAVRTIIDFELESKLS